MSHGEDANRTIRIERSRGSGEPEIQDYLRLIRRRWWIILLVPAFAAGVVVWAHSDDPVRYSAKATVSARSLIGHVNSPYVGTRSTEEFAADFQATATQKPILQTVSETTQVSPDSIRDGVSVTPLSTTAGMSALIDVEYITTDRDRAGPVAKQVALATVRALFEPAFRNSAIATEDRTTPPVAEGTTDSLDELLQHPQTLTLYSTTVVSYTESVIREVQIAVGAGLFLAIFIVIIAELSTPPARRVPPPPPPAPPPPPPGSSWQEGPRSRGREDTRMAYDDEASAHETSHTAPQAPASGAR